MTDKIGAAVVGVGYLGRFRDALAEDRATAALTGGRALFYGADGQPLAVGTTVRNPALGAFLRRLAAEGPSAFYSGSNAAANAMLIQLQAEVADQLGMATEEIAVLQNAAAAHMTMASPSRVLLAASVCQIPSEENRLLKAVAPIAVAAVFSLTIL